MMKPYTLKTNTCFSFVITAQCDYAGSLFAKYILASVKWERCPTLLLLRTSSRCHRLSATFTLLGNCSTTVPEPWLIFKVGVPSISSRWRERKWERQGELVRDESTLISVEFKKYLILRSVINSLFLNCWQQTLGAAILRLEQDWNYCSWDMTNKCHSEYSKCDLNW